jgi:hypothetical protein
MKIWSPGMRRGLVWAIVAVSIGWTLYDWNGLTAVEGRLSSVFALAVALVVSECMFVAGSCMVAAALGRHVFAGVGASPVRALRAVAGIRGQYREIAARATKSRMFTWGFVINWIGAAMTGVVVFVGILIVLPMTAWGLLVLPVLDLVATFGWRVPIAAKLQATGTAS